MISFLSPDGKAVALAVKDGERKLFTKIYMLQDVTGDGMLDKNDLIIIKRESQKIFNNSNLKEGQLKLFLNDAEYG